MRPDEFKEKLILLDQEYLKNKDFETVSWQVGAIVCDFLESLGYKEEADITRPYL